MAAGYQDDDAKPLDPIFGRIEIVGYVEELLTRQMGAMAIHVTDDLEVIQLLSGSVEPFANETGDYYRGVNVNLFGVTTSERRLAELSFSDMSHGSIVYNLPLTQQHLDELTHKDDSNEIAWHDSHAYHKLKRTTFIENRAKLVMKNMLADETTFADRMQKWRRPL